MKTRVEQRTGIELYFKIRKTATKSYLTLKTAYEGINNCLAQTVAYFRGWESKMGNTFLGAANLSKRYVKKRIWILNNISKITGTDYGMFNISIITTHNVNF